ncbi:TRAP transporter small permease [Phyllobacterium phragmitis]|uniref:TRAP transporter small permease protein n=1 Tax=Phyllobacterium phragmitis TaxID=2670329 RepID=A0A2S9IVY5_9HYPH|nr:TRAP transporter small permease [Phyllobacterium phragmitis]PRD44689.1 TRAP transporter small permease [Phyllobacterium phragmitis]
MQTAIRQSAAVLSRISMLALWVAGIGLVLMTVFTGWQVWSRYVLNASPSWTEPLSILLMNWFIFLGAAVGVREGYHLGFDVVLFLLPEKGKAVLRSISDIAVLFFGAGMVWYGFDLTRGTWSAVMPSLGLPVGVDYLPILGGGILIVLFTLERLARRFSGQETFDVEMLDATA